MCGIAGCVGERDAAPVIFEALKRLEYRGYDSGGLAVLEKGGIRRRRAKGKLEVLGGVLKAKPLRGSVGIGHTRWATHGKPSVRNAHPHMAEGVAVVHNGIIENSEALKKGFRGARARARFLSETDSEVIAWLIARERKKHGAAEAVRRAALRLEGSFAIAVLFEDEEERIFGACRGSPLVIGFGKGCAYLASDARAFGNRVDFICRLESGDIAALGREGVEVWGEKGKKVQRAGQFVLQAPEVVNKGNHHHFMEKEIHEQPESLGRVLNSYIDRETQKIRLPDTSKDLQKGVKFIGCGSAAYAGMVGAYWFERYAGIRATCEIASEFRYREPVVGEEEVLVFISQSGETADTLGALRHSGVKKRIVLVNEVESSLAREARNVMLLLAGSEIGVAATKTYTAQLAVLAAFAIGAARESERMTQEQEKCHVASLLGLPKKIEAVLENRRHVKRIVGKHLRGASYALYLGRGGQYPVALEGALKCKEISCLSAEGYPAGEMKHGPLALVDKDVPVIMLMPSDEMFDRMLSSLHEVRARGGRVILVTDGKGAEKAGAYAAEQIVLPGAEAFAAPILWTIPMQLLAYETALARGFDPDRPRNLAKSVTVE